MASFYANENFPLPAVEELRRLGHDVLTSSEAGQADQALDDERVLAFAVRQGRILLTLNRRHFVALHGRRPSHSGIVACSLDLDFPSLARRVHEAAGSGSLAGKLVRVNRPG